MKKIFAHLFVSYNYVIGLSWLVSIGVHQVQVVAFSLLFCIQVMNMAHNHPLSAQYWGELWPDSPTYARFPNLLYTAELLCIKQK